ncbi:hypothetical protein UFOVP203_55 [uncultured Caudovirales phage]|uniref:Uncharacterized protein n=1 Tax=uncultured Caudovirales phage TaxID=2100421 RepID=A0A6J7WPQ1_9CAUD|nr:hypothetical protein UFOVP203_55 [uncultured Caudovirales phage]
MITAMQIMLDDLLSKRDVYLNAKMYESVATLETSINVAEALIEKEKEQIIDAYEAAMERPIDNYAEAYYNMNYNQTYNL